MAASGERQRGMRAGRTRGPGTVLAAAFALALAFAPAPAAADEPAFLEGSEDIPLMEELTAVPDAGIVFDSPAGRIVETYAAGETGREAVRGFYAEALPPLGWTARGPARYEREGEVLTLDFFGPDGALTVRFTLAPSEP